MAKEDGTPLDIGDLWRIYFGEIEPPFFDAKDAIELDDDLAALVCNKIAKLFGKHSQQFEIGQTEWLDLELESAGVGTRDRIRLLKGVFLGVSELDAGELRSNVEAIVKVLNALTGKMFTEQQVYELCLEDV
jgi:hypothetical protein